MILLYRLYFPGIKELPRTESYLSIECLYIDRIMFFGLDTSCKEMLENLGCEVFDLSIVK